MVHHPPVLRRYPLVIALLIFICYLPNHLAAQEQRFKAGIVLGLNFSELEGEGLMDYFGLNTGVFGTARLSKRFQLGMEFLFSQNGEYILPQYYPPIEYGAVWLNHLEIPFHIDWLVQVSRREKDHHLNFNLGIAYARILSYSAEDAQKIDVSEQLVYADKDAFLMQTGMTYQFTPKMGLNLKASLPIRKQVLGLTLAARLMYTI